MSLERRYTAAEVEEIFWFQSSPGANAGCDLHQLRAVHDADPNSDEMTIFREWLSKWSAQMWYGGARSLFEVVFARPLKGDLDLEEGQPNPPG